MRCSNMPHQHINGFYVIHSVGGVVPQSKNCGASKGCSRPTSLHVQGEEIPRKFRDEEIQLRSPDFDFWYLNFRFVLSSIVEKISPIPR